MLGFDPGISDTAVRHVTTRPLQTTLDWFINKIESLQSLQNTDE